MGIRKPAIFLMAGFFHGCRFLFYVAHGTGLCTQLQRLNPQFRDGNESSGRKKTLAV
jgi:hypothetical protein